MWTEIIDTMLRCKVVIGESLQEVCRITSPWKLNLNRRLSLYFISLMSFFVPVNYSLQLSNIFQHFPL